MVYRYSRFGDGLSKQDLRRDVNAALLAIEDETRPYHSPIVTASFHSALPGTAPTPGAVNALLYLTFSSGDAAFRQFKIPESFASSPAFHVHWTKSGNGNEAGKAVRWKISYVIFPSEPDDPGIGSATPATAEVEGVYVSTGTTDRVVYSTEDIPMTGFVKGHYLCIKVERTTPNGAPMSSNPGLFSVDLTYTEYVNRR